MRTTHKLHSLIGIPLKLLLLRGFRVGELPSRNSFFLKNFLIIELPVEDFSCQNFLKQPPCRRTFMLKNSLCCVIKLTSLCCEMTLVAKHEARQQNIRDERSAAPFFLGFSCFGMEITRCRILRVLLGMNYVICVDDVRSGKFAAVTFTVIGKVGQSCDRDQRNSDRLGRHDSS